MISRIVLSLVLLVNIFHQTPGSADMEIFDNTPDDSLSQLMDNTTHLIENPTENNISSLSAETKFLIEASKLPLFKIARQIPNYSLPVIIIMGLIGI